MTNESSDDSLWSIHGAEFFYPTKVDILEAMRWIDRPLSAGELAKVFGRAHPLSNVSYHIQDLAKRGVLKIADKQQVRGALRKRYRIAKSRDSKDG